MTGRNLMANARLMVLVSLASGAGKEVFAQPSWEDRVFVHVGAGYQTATQSFGYSDSQTIFQETATASLEMTGKDDFIWEAGGGVRVFRNLGLGVTYTTYETEASAVLSASIPHPLLFNRNATDTLDLPVKREEQAIHVEISYLFSLASKLQVRAFGGPSRLEFKQDAVSNFRINGELDFPDFTIELSDPEVQELSGNDWGYNLGADVSYLFSNHIGVGGTVRYVRASAEVENVLETTRTLLSNTNATIDLGGLQLLAGIRIRF